MVSRRAPRAIRLTTWGTASANGPSNIIFDAAPGAGVAIRVDFSYYWPCGFARDSSDFSQLVSQYYEFKKLAFMSVTT
jgi:hypothetical protein